MKPQRRVESFGLTGNRADGCELSDDARWCCPASQSQNGPIDCYDCYLEDADLCSPPCENSETFAECGGPLVAGDWIAASTDTYLLAQTKFGQKCKGAQRQSDQGWGCVLEMTLDDVLRMTTIDPRTRIVELSLPPSCGLPLHCSFVCCGLRQPPPRPPLPSRARSFGKRTPLPSKRACFPQWAQGSRGGEVVGWAGQAGGTRLKRNIIRGA